MKRISSVLALAAALLGFGCASAPGNAIRMEKAASEDRMVAYTVNLRLSVKNVEDAQKGLMDRVEDFGGFITRNGTEYSIVRIPAEKLNEYLDVAKALGEVDELEINGEDITEEYADTLLRLEGQRQVRGKYLLILEKASSVEDLLAIEKELERVTYEIERLEGQKKAAEMRVQYATVTIRITKEVRPGPLGWIFWLAFKAVQWLFVWK